MSNQFLDKLTIRVKAGNGGSGCVSFRREKYIPRGGPDGGDGGEGGSVFLESSSRVLSLSHLFPDKLYAGENGYPGMGRHKTGKAGVHMVIQIPVGTQIFSLETQKQLYDFVDESRFLLAKAGRGGKGNTHFKNSVRQTPDYSQPGESTEEFSILLSLKLIADAGLVGFPNAGKSTLLKALTNAKPKIADYAFTTLNPNLGYIDYEHIERVLIADIPGILEGASRGHGLGLSFLKHIERVKLILFVLDINTATEKDELLLLQKELDAYSLKLRNKPYLIVINKIDRIDSREFLNEWISEIVGDSAHSLVSAQTGEGIPQLKEKVRQMIQALKV